MSLSQVFGVDGVGEPLQPVRLELADGSGEVLEFQVGMAVYEYGGVWILGENTNKIQQNTTVLGWFVHILWYFGGNFGGIWGFCGILDFCGIFGGILCVLLYNPIHTPPYSYTAIPPI